MTHLQSCVQQERRAGGFLLLPQYTIAFAHSVAQSPLLTNEEVAKQACLERGSDGFSHTCSEGHLSKKAGYFRVNQTTTRKVPAMSLLELFCCVDDFWLAFAPLWKQ